MATEPPPADNRPSPFAVVLWAAALYIFITAFDQISRILLALLLVLLVGLALNPVVVGLRRRLGGRSRATALVIFTFLVIATLTGWGVYRPMKASMTKFIQRLPDYWERVQKPLMKMEEKAAVSQEKLKREVRTEIKEEVQRTNAPPDERHAVAVTEQRAEKAATAPAPEGGFMRTGLNQVLGGVGGTFKNLASNLAQTVMIALTVFVGVIFTLLNPRPIISFVFAMIPERHHQTTQRVAQRIIRMIPRWALATILGMSIIGVMVFLAMWLVLGFQDALVLGLIAFVLEAVPYLGPILAVVPAVLLGIGDGGLTPVWVLLAYAAIQVIENNVIYPVIIAGRLRLQPVAALFSMVICVAVFGILGVLLAVPMVAVFNILYEELYRPKVTPNVSDEDLDELARTTLDAGNSPSQKKDSKKSKRAK